jgi:hypothetical protein
LPSPPAPAELQQAKVDFFEALVNRDQRAARAASTVMARYSRPERRLSPAEAEKRAPRMRFLVKCRSATIRLCPSPRPAEKKARRASFPLRPFSAPIPAGPKQSDFNAL